LNIIQISSIFEGIYREFLFLNKIEWVVNMAYRFTENIMTDKLWEPLIISNFSLPSRIKYGVNSSGNPAMLKTYGFLLAQE
jgi:hypothetical protein